MRLLPPTAAVALLVLAACAPPPPQPQIPAATPEPAPAPAPGPGPGAGLGPGLGPGSSRHVVLVSIDGMRPDYYTQADRYHLAIPSLRSLMQRGRYAEAVIGTWPTVTYPAHTTLVTGARPNRHGILANRPFDPVYKNQGGWNWYAESIKADTLWAALRRAGKTTGSVYWPVTVGAAIDDDFPQMWRAKIDEDDRLLRALTSPGLAEAYTKEYGAQHQFGPGSKQALATLERIDGELGRVLRGIDAAGDGARTAVFVVSDHGFAPVKSVIRPAVLLRDAGLIEVRPGGAVSRWQAGVLAAGGMAAIYLRDPSDPVLVDRVAKVLDDAASDPRLGIRAVDRREVSEREGGFAGATFTLEAAPGFEFDAALTGAPVGPAGDKGAHGYPPEDADMHASLIAAGAGIRPGSPLPRVSMLAIAPTIASLLGVTLADAEAAPMEELLADAPAAAGPPAGR